MRLAPTLALALLACEAGPRIPLPPRGPCADEVPDEEVRGGRVVVFPERDWICPAEPPDATCRPLRSDPERTVRVTEELGGATFVFVLDRMTIPVRGTPRGQGENRETMSSQRRVRSSSSPIISTIHRRT